MPEWRHQLHPVAGWGRPTRPSTLSPSSQPAPATNSSLQAIIPTSQLVLCSNSTGSWFCRVFVVSIYRTTCRQQSATLQPIHNVSTKSSTTVIISSHFLFFFSFFLFFFFYFFHSSYTIKDVHVILCFNIFRLDRLLYVVWKCFLYVCMYVCLICALHYYLLKSNQWSLSISRQSHITTGRFCWSKALLPVYPCWRQLEANQRWSAICRVWPWTLTYQNMNWQSYSHMQM